MSSTPHTTPDRLRIWQQNLNKSRTAQEDLINSNLHEEFDILLLQELFIDSYGNMKATQYWRVIYPSLHLSELLPLRVVILVSVLLDTNIWSQIHILNTRDITAVQIVGSFGFINILDIYNDCHNMDTVELMGACQLPRPAGIPSNGPKYMIWGGDFNCHHPLWDEEQNHHLFTAAVLADSNRLLEIVADHNMEMTLPKDLPTLEVMSTKNWTRPDNVFCSVNLADKIIRCDTDLSRRGPGADHVPIITAVELLAKWTGSNPLHNFQATDWEAFGNVLSMRLNIVPDLALILSEDDFTQAVSKLVKVLQDTIQAVVPKMRPSPYAKQWWNNNLIARKKAKNKLSGLAYKYLALPGHPIHGEHRALRQKYSKAIMKAKWDHWSMFIEGLSYRDIWIANRYISKDGTDGGKTRIPTLMLHPSEPDWPTTVATMNEEKSVMLATLMFPARPESVTLLEEPCNEPLQNPQAITESQIRCHISQLSPYKALGPDGIPNIMLKKCAKLILPYLLQIFQAVLSLNIYPNQWREIEMCMLCKPGKLRYDVLKAYRLFALVNTIAKLFSSFIVEDITYLTEKHELLPANHFGRRPGQTTTDSLDLLVDSVKAAWRRKQVASVLFLDVEGAFPNVVKERLLHNLCKRQIPDAYVAIINNMLTNRWNQLKFDDFKSEWFQLDNGIIQGDPLSMMLYLYYNVDMLEIPHRKEEMCLGYVDDLAIVAFVRMFEGTHKLLLDMLMREGGAQDWVDRHDSVFEASKSMLIDFSQDKRVTQPAMTFQGATITPQHSHKFIGVMLNQGLCWKVQVDYALAKVTKWVLTFRRLARPGGRANLRVMRQLFCTVAIPKMTYVLDVWYMPVHKKEGAGQ